MNVVSIGIPSWKKFNASDIKRTPHWFKVHMDIGSSESLFGLSYCTKWVWICLLGEAMRKRSAKFDLNTAWAASKWKMEEQALYEGIEFLKKRGLLTADWQSTDSLMPVNCHLEREVEREREIEREIEGQTKTKKELSEGRGQASSNEEGIQKFIGVYITAFKTRYPKGRPDLGGKVQGQIKRFLKDQDNFQRCCELIQVYFQIEDSWFETKNYDFSTFISNVTKIGNALDSGGSSSNGLQAWYLKQKEKESVKEISA